MVLSLSDCNISGSAWQIDSLSNLCTKLKTNKAKINKDKK